MRPMTRAGIVEVMRISTASSGGASPTRVIIIDDHEITRAAYTAPVSYTHLTLPTKA